MTEVISFLILVIIWGFLLLMFVAGLMFLATLVLAPIAMLVGKMKGK